MRPKVGEEVRQLAEQTELWSERLDTLGTAGGSRIEDSPATVEQRLDPNVRVSALHDEVSGARILVPTFETADQSSGDVDCSQHQAQRRGEVLAMTLLAIEEKILDRVDRRIIDGHIERVAELTGVSQVMQNPSRLVGRRRIRSVGWIRDLPSQFLEPIQPARQGAVIVDLARIKRNEVRPAREWDVSLGPGFARINLVLQSLAARYVLVAIEHGSDSPFGHSRQTVFQRPGDVLRHRKQDSGIHGLGSKLLSNAVLRGCCWNILRPVIFSRRTDTPFPVFVFAHDRAAKQRLVKAHLSGVRDDVDRLIVLLIEHPHFQDRVGSLQNLADVAELHFL